jgi:transcriptional regulator GlxA family with amidase domain
VAGAHSTGASRDDLSPIVETFHDSLVQFSYQHRAHDSQRKNLDTPLTVEQLAEAAHLSPRQFSRAFRAETGQSPAKAVENLRVEAARLMMEQSRHPIDIIARQTGFAERDRMRRAFLRAFGQPPQVIRRNARAEAAA